MFTVLTTLYNLLIATYHLFTPRHASRLKAMQPRQAPDPSHAPQVAVLVPMRDELHHARRCLEAIFAQDYPATHFELIVIDDGSTDGTHDLLQEIQSERGRWSRPRLRILKTPPLQPGWTGKSQALWWGSQAVADTVRWLLFVDADTFLQPSALSTMVREAQARDLEMLSLQPHEELVSWWEKVIYPVSLMQLMRSVDLRTVNDDRRPDMAWANGQCLLVRHDAYISIGTHEAVRGDLLESVALARRMRERGYTVRMVNGAALAQTRKWEGFSDLWESYQKEGIVLYQGSLLRVAVTTLALALLDLLPFLWPWLALQRQRSRNHVVATFAFTLMPPLAVVVKRVRGAKYVGISTWYAFTHPIGVAATLIIAWSSLLRLWLSQPINWKGRRYLPQRWATWWTEAASSTMVALRTRSSSQQES